MNTPNTGEIRPKSVISFTEADELRGRVLLLVQNTSSVMTLASDLAHDYARDMRLSAIHADLAGAYDRLTHARELIVSVWGSAAEAADQGGRSHG
ncbi:hypothetical protein F6R98_20060 [Candidatus Methylospira mobilis]|uniref:Uncharacterized protein n=1 Tax=Candidatus Methylospira mobilis TaxID=1808979 RepID=A0A5Q0BRD7_9GAMM|nr:hypothetical protein [Candidatus Methylospira mobilis]QFY44638.1 hypothetical protein F6R98_20060 [Candidatus Methylospira mobilis]